MKALTIRQPHITLIIEGAKIYETRTWPPPKSLIGKEIALHAGKRKPTKKELEEGLAFFTGEPENIIRRAIAGTLPLGVVLGTAIIYKIHRTDDVVEPATGILYERGLYAWELRYIKVYENPIPAKGVLGIWEWEQSEATG